MNEFDSSVNSLLRKKKDTAFQFVFAINKALLSEIEPLK